MHINSLNDKVYRHSLVKFGFSIKWRSVPKLQVIIKKSDLIRQTPNAGFSLKQYLKKVKDKLVSGIHPKVYTRKELMFFLSCFSRLNASWKVSYSVNVFSGQTPLGFHSPNYSFTAKGDRSAKARCGRVCWGNKVKIELNYATKEWFCCLVVS